MIRQFSARCIVLILILSLCIPTAVLFAEETTQTGQTGQTTQTGQTGQTAQPGQTTQTGQTGQTDQTTQTGQTGQTTQPGQTTQEEQPKKSKTIRNGYDAEGNFYDSAGYMIRKSTIRNLLEVALQPVGKTMYIWGGGHQGPEQTMIGVSPQWEKFFKQQTSSYNYQNTRWQYRNGLDCSGYVGWVMYNTFHTKSGQGSCTMLAEHMTGTFANWGWGQYWSARKFRVHKAGDVMSLASGHVYIVIGRCSDGSVVLVHASPQGVMINGTVTKKGKKFSKAWKLARKYMRKYYPEWFAKYKDVRKSISYLKSYSKMAWTIGTGKSVMSDPDGLRNMNAEQVLRVIFHEV